MPFARIDLIKGKSPEHRSKIGDIIYDAMFEILKSPEHDRFQVITEHSETNFIFDPHFFGIERSKQLVFIQLFLSAGRTREQKKEFYKKVADDLHAELGMRREDVFIHLVQTEREDWSVGNGEASLVKST